MSKNQLKDLNEKRKGSYYKDPKEENFLENLNEFLFSKEQNEYQNLSPAYPHIFIFGLPRSGTTLLSQVIAHGLNTGFINNFSARFWLAPVHGIKLSDTILKGLPEPTFNSDFGSTKNLKDIHEFGYFWRYWLKKDDMANIKNAKSLENKINWQGLIKTLANIQLQYDKPMVYKNIFGSYHMERLTQELSNNALWVYIERDPLDVAVSILKARKKFYTDLNTWWSYAPPNYEELLSLDYWDQIAGQIHYLKRYYNEQQEKMKRNQPVVSVKYSDLAQNPIAVLNTIQQELRKRFDIEISLKQDPSDRIEYRSYGSSDEKKTFAERLSKFEENES